MHVRVQLKNTGNDVALENKLTLLNASGARILPAYYSDNYVSLLPGESKEIDIEYPASAAPGAAQVAIRGWNLMPQKVAVRVAKRRRGRLRHALLVGAKLRGQERPRHTSQLNSRGGI